MPIEMINDLPYLWDVEYNFLASMELHNELERYWPDLLAGRDAVQELGYEVRVYQDMSLWPIDFLVKQIRLRARQRAGGNNEFAYVQVPGREEDLNGRVYTQEEMEPGKPGHKRHADQSLIGPASLVGKIALELARRLEVELTGDAMAVSTAWQPKTWEEDVHDPPAFDR